MDFGLVVKPLGITVKKEAGKVVETSDIVRTQATREFPKEGQEPRSPKGGPEKIFENFEFQNFRKSFWAPLLGSRALAPLFETLLWLGS